MSHRILVLGASGGCGRQVVAQAIARGHAVTAVIRPHTAYVPPRDATIVHDDILREGSIARAIIGHDVVISCVGIRRRWPRNPWSRLMSPPDLVSRVTRALVDAAQLAGVARVLAISAAGVADSAPRTNAVMRWLIARSNLGPAYHDLADAEAILAASDLDWTAIRPVTLSSGRSLRAREVVRYGVLSSIPRAAVAAWLLDHVDVTDATRTPMIARA
jgi:putative NADH-flavin reductase